MRTGQLSFLLDFGSEVWRDETASWTPADLQKILTNFLDEQTGDPIFRLEETEHGLELKMEVKANIGVIMPRGFSKTTIMNAANLRDALYKIEDFFLYVSESAPHSEKQLGTLKAELEDNNGLPNNETVNVVFGNHKPDRQSPLKWTENYIETLKGVMIGAVGRGGQIRGFGKRAKRPGVITYDDLEDQDSVDSDTQRKKDRKWFFQAALPAVRKSGRSFLIGTLLHTDAILNKIMLSREWTCVRFGAIDKQGEALWSFMLDLEEVEQKRLASIEVGEMAGFYLEYMSENRVDESRMFPESKLIYVHKGTELFIGMAEAMDPAISEESTADFCTFGVVGIEKSGTKHVLDYYGQVGMDPADQVEKFFELHFKWLCRIPAEYRKHGIEAIGYQRSLLHIVKTLQYAKTQQHGYNAHFEIIPIFHGKIGKIPRIKGILKPLIQSGYLTFDQMWPDLHSMFTDFPRGKKDGPDVLAMAVSLLDPFASLSLDPNFNPAADTAEPLAKVLGGNFRKAP